MRIARTDYGHTLVFRDFCYFFGNQFVGYLSKALCWQCDESNAKPCISGTGFTILPVRAVLPMRPHQSSRPGSNFADCPG